MSRLLEDDPDDPDEAAAAHDAEEEAVEQPISLNEQCVAAVTEVIVGAGARRVLDLGCGQGKLVQALLKLSTIQQVVGVDMSYRALEIAGRRLHLESMAPRQRDRAELLQGLLTNRDRRLQGFDAAAIVEVMEHLEPSRLGSFERVVFAYAHPALVVLTTPNVAYNVRFENLPVESLRYWDHRFEWTRLEFATWIRGVAERHGYEVVISGIGPIDAEVGSPTQMAVFSQ